MAERRRRILFGDGREFQGTPIEIVEAMAQAMFSDGISTDYFIDWLRGQLKGSVGLIDVPPGPEADRARVLINQMIEKKVVDDLDNPSITTVLLMEAEPMEHVQRKGSKKDRRREKLLH